MDSAEENTWYRVFSFTIEAKTASDHEEFHEKARATIQQAQILLEEEKKKRDQEFIKAVGDSRSGDISVHSVFIKSYTLKVIENRFHVETIQNTPKSILIASGLQRIHTGP